MYTLVIVYYFTATINSTLEEIYSFRDELKGTSQLKVEVFSNKKILGQFLKRILGF